MRHLVTFSSNNNKPQRWGKGVMLEHILRNLMLKLFPKLFGGLTFVFLYCLLTLSSFAEGDTPEGFRAGHAHDRIHPSLFEVVDPADELAVIIRLRHQPLQRAEKKTETNTQKAIKKKAQEVRQTIFRQDHTFYRKSDDEKKSKRGLSFFRRKQGVLNAYHADIDNLNNVFRNSISTRVGFEVMDEQNEIVTYIKQAGGKVGHISRLANSVSAIFRAHEFQAIEALADNPLVESITPDFVYELDLDISSHSIGSPDWWDAGFDGGIYDAGLLDSGIRDDHIFLKFYDPFVMPPSQPRSIFKQTPGYSGTHGTRTAGIIAGTHDFHTGLAYGLDALFDAGGHMYMTQSQIMTNLDWMLNCPETEETPDVINLSFSLYSGIDEHDSLAQFLDVIVDRLGIAITKSAGNKGSYELGYPQSYNLISVANLDIKDNLDPADDEIYPSSSRGPTVSGRRKPDITAPGHNTWTTDSASSSAFANHSGTSAAAPHVAGAILLLAHSGIIDPKAQKAVLINTARTWSDNGTLEDYRDDGPVSTGRWDPTYGWGVIDLEHSFFHRNDWQSQTVAADNQTFIDDDYKLFKGRMAPGDKATLVWHMHHSSSTDLPQLTDLNLTVYDEMEGSLLDSDLDVNDNVHQVSSTMEADVVIKVFSASPIIDGGTEEEFILATEENFVPVSPPSFQLYFSLPDIIEPGQTFDLSVQVVNTGETPAHNNTLTLGTVTGLSNNDNPTCQLPSIMPEHDTGDGVTVDFSLTADNLPAGDHWLSLSFMSDSYGERYSYSNEQAILITVSDQLPGAACTAETDFNLDGDVDGGDIGAYALVGDFTAINAFASSFGMLCNQKESREEILGQDLYVIN